MTALQGRIAIVTGASKGIGAGIAQALADAGASVVVNYAGNQTDAGRVVHKITDAGGRAVAIQADVSNRKDVERLFSQTMAVLGAPDIIVNNAGVFSFQPLEEIAEAEFHRQFDVNVLGTILIAQEAAKHFPASGGSIINIGSTASANPEANSAIYSASKAAVDTVSRALAQELGPRGIRVNTLAPGGVETEGTRANGLIGSDAERQIIAATPLGRFGQPADIGRVAAFLASDAAGWITGERIVVSGGFR
ncbi:SDR family NAD(P)-dependent oxidoreductase [Paracoccus sp. J56]|uniref:SDR family NAD(P)-dependent oxidoreductase n=1 Tax=Paracoccus sp. J56 TaxID=935850 RepID=UPI000A0B1228|nr:glucose 1-dehydrogenase [Paracoccus sp. J56]SMG19318.1 3-oxoacyl-[acyl-carrier protein] reductase [Paracoccus sp. J56]